MACKRGTQRVQQLLGIRTIAYARLAISIAICYSLSYSLYLRPSMLTKVGLFQAHQVPLDLVHHLGLHPVMKEGSLQH